MTAGRELALRRQGAFMALQKERLPRLSVDRAASRTRAQWRRRDTRTGSLLVRWRLAVSRAICEIADHRLASPRSRRLDTGDLLYRTDCTRCDFAALGDWHEMERLHAWEHYRRSF